MASVSVSQYQNEDFQQQVDERSTASSSPAPSDVSSNDEPQKIAMLDPSEHYRPDLDTNGKALEAFRKYSEDEEDEIQRRVKRTYYTMHKNQTVDFVRARLQKWKNETRAEMTIMEALEKLNDLLDESDPDNDLPNIVHAFQTAERIRKDHPDKPWFQLTGLIHDLGKVLAFWGEEQWAVVGDTYVVGCRPADSIVYRERSFDECPDMKDSRYNTKYGIYKPHCGLENVMFSSSHDTYLYTILKKHPECRLPEAGLKCILLHSFYPWHTGGDYMHLCNDSNDLEALKWVREFNKYDLYSKNDYVPNPEEMAELKVYYQGLIDEYLGSGKVKF